MSSTSPPFTTPHHDSDKEPTSPVRDPDVERELTPVEAVRERADGETSPPLLQLSSDNDKESDKEKAAKKDQDLDKDIDAMFEYNANGFGDASVSLGSIPIDSADSTLKDISIKSSSFVERGEVGMNGNGSERQDIKTHDSERWEGSEKSFTSISTSNSSILAEAVVNRVLTNAVKLTQEGDEAKTGDVKVGLFQYQAGDSDVGFQKTELEMKTGGGPTETEPGDVKVGLFQYFDGGEDNIQQDLEGDQSDVEPDLSGLDIDETDEKLESLNLSDKENILHLYGLGGSEVTETRLMATPPGSPRTDDEKREFFIDVQREVYEPQKRMFSVQDKSSAESTPRDQVNEGASPNEENDTELDHQFIEEDSAFAETIQKLVPARVSPAKSEGQEENISVREDTIDSDTEAKKDGGWAKEPPPVSIEVAPPLIHYESVKENGKFRIIKMPKEGYGPTVGTIRAGVESSSSQSPDQSPRATEVQATSQTPKEVKVISQKSREVKDTGQKPEVKDTGTKVIDRKRKTEERGITVGGVSRDVKETVDIIDDQLEEPLNSISQTLPVVTPSSSTEMEEKEKLWQPSIEQVIRSYSDSREVIGTSRDVTRADAGSLLKEPGLSRSELVSGSPTRRSRPQDESRSHRLLAEKQASPRRGDIDPRIKYSTTDTHGRETKRTGPVPYNMEDNREVPGSDYSYLGADAGRYPSSYEAELIQSAYNRVSDKTGEPVPKVVTSAIDIGPIPGYKTLQEQQARWASMFKTLEDHHKMELRSQYERHQYNIHRLQQQMESELQKQHQTIRKKLDIHKEALRRMSPERDNLFPDRGYATSDRDQRSPDRSQRSPLQEHRSPIGQQRSPRSPVRDERSSIRGQRSPVINRISPERDRVLPVRGHERMDPVRSQRSPDRSRERRSRSADGSLDRPESKTWREIYKEVRAEEEKRDPTPPPPVKRSLEDDFADLEDTTLTRSRSSLGRSALSPRTRISPNRERILPGRERISPERDKISPGRDGYKERERGMAQETPERQNSEVERESRSRSKRSPQQLVPPLLLSKEEPDRATPVRPTTISPHVQELLDNLNEGRSSLRGLQSPPRHVEGGNKDLPRAGVYSSPMPLLTGKVSKSTQSSKTTLDASVSLDVSRSQSYYDRSLDESRKSHETTIDRSLNDSRKSHETTIDRSLDDSRKHTIDRRLDDSCLSSSARMNLREKHSKHLADLRSYYEEELRELRRALTESLLDTSGASVDHGGHATIENHLLEAENRHLLDKCRTMEDELEDLYQRLRELEQKGKGLEKRASEYAAAFADSQAMGMQNRAHIEELQRYCRERDDLVNDLEAKVKSQEDAMKIYKKNLEEELELHRQDKSALQRICDKYESMEREQKLLQETINAAENKLYDTRTEVVELNRKISKLELENKRLGRENDNLRHKVTQSINLTSIHESFGSPSSPRQPDPPSRRRSSSPPPFTSQSPDIRIPNFMGTPEPRPKSADVRIPSFTGTPEPRPKSVGARDSSEVNREKVKKSKPTDWKDKKENVSEVKDTKMSSKVSREDLADRPRSGQLDREPSQERLLRDTTSPRPASVASQDELETGDYSPMIKAERELYKLRDMMRQAVAVKPASSPPPEPVLQKKFYGSERPSSKDEYIPDFGTPRGRKDKQPSSHTSVAKTKSNSTHSRQERPEKDKSNKKSTASSSKSDKSSKVKDKAKERPKDTETRQRTPTKKDLDKSRVSVKPDEFNSSTRFDVSIDEDTKTLSVKKVVSQSGKQKNLFAESNQSTSERSYDQNIQRSHDPVVQISHDESTQTSEQDLTMQQTLDRMRAGNYTTRPQWEDVFTSMAKPKPEDEHKVKVMTREDKIKDRLRSIADMEHRYDELQLEKRQLESNLTRIPIHGRVNGNNRRQKEELEERLDTVEKELGSLRMSLKRCNVLKTVG